MKRAVSLMVLLGILGALIGCDRNTSDVVNPGQGLPWATLAGTLAHGDPDLDLPTPKPTRSLDAPMFTLLSDDFSDPESGWPVYADEYGNSAYSRGAFEIKSIQEKYYSWRTAGLNADNIRIDVDVRVRQTNSEKDDGFGVDCRIQENGDGYGFRISSDGYITISLYVDLEASSLLEWQESSAIYTDGRVNHIAVVCDADQFTFFVNDIQVAQVTDDTFKSGDVALSVISFTAEPVAVAFDNLVVRQFSD